MDSSIRTMAPQTRARSAATVAVVAKQTSADSTAAKATLAEPKAGPVIHHLGGSRSMYQHMQSLVSKKGDDGEDVGIMDLFDATHTKQTPSGKIYVNEKAKRHAEKFQELRQQRGPEELDEELWEIMVGGEKRGTVFGLGKRSRISKKTLRLQEMQHSAPSPTKSTATTATRINLDKDIKLNYYQMIF